jgi:hypothetical protein
MLININKIEITPTPRLDVHAKFLRGSLTSARTYVGSAMVLPT